LYGKNENVSTDELGPEQKNQLKQFVFWTAVAIIGGFVLLRVIPQLI
jgi:hypothetical protein